MEAFEALYNDYRRRFPDAQDPLDFLQAFGEEGLAEVLEQAAGREVVFAELPELDKVEYSYR